jgi:aspartyl-tRNA(Asn)/glutamyl-tRNA(Gln) amidotransferase subunit A
MPNEILDLTLTEISDRIGAREVSSRAATEACLAAIERLQPQINCFIHAEAEQALAMADAADREIAGGRRRGALQGVPLAHKDIFYRAGSRTTSGSKLTENFRPSYTGWVVERLDEAGAVDLGGLNLAEFCVGPTGHNDYFGHCRNPWDRARISGGSSSGSAAAVSARLIYGSIGSDTGGSIRLPAGICGVTGLKPTHGRVSLYGATRRCWSLDCFGPLARDAQDVAVLLQSIAGFDERDPYCRPVPVPDYREALRARLTPLRIGVPRNHIWPDLAAHLVPIHQEALAVFRALGCEIIDVDISDPEELYERTVVINQVEASYIHQEWIRTRREDYNISTISRIEQGFDIPAIRYIEALEERAAARARFELEVFSKIDALYCPLLVIDTPGIEETDIRRAEQAAGIVHRVTRATRWVSYVGLPVLTLPCGFSRQGMPVAAQLIGPAFAEDRLLRLGYRFQGATDWHARRPPSLALSPAP